jgi:hypothetical protein
MAGGDERHPRLPGHGRPSRGVRVSYACLRGFTRHRVTVWNTGLAGIGRPHTGCFFRPQSLGNIESCAKNYSHHASIYRGCSHAISVASCVGTIKERMAKFEVLPLSAVIAIGSPLDEERTVAGKKVYIWGSLVDPTKPAKDKQCQIRATMNGDVIESFDYQGDEELCQRYAARLRP